MPVVSSHKPLSSKPPLYTTFGMVSEEVLGGLLSPILGHPAELLRESMLIGSANECVEKLANLQTAGVRKVFLWPVGDDAVQLTKFHEEVLPQLPS
jgi:alkanesulfonate monooxygenase SsuD/methylene tetrahydromethanopterin reductase-like flavin-dependent oxidoreductase (luciferase family)